jgi:hypothetical protein
MNGKADWIVVVGFLLAIFGVALRIFIMMRSSETRPVNVAPKASHSLVRDFNSAFPKSRLPLLMQISLYAGVVLLIAGLLLEFR